MHTLENGVVLDTLNPELAAQAARSLPPQDLAEIRALVERIRRAVNDSLVDVRWNPLSYVTRPGQFDVYGAPIPPAYEGRWEVIRDLGDGIAPFVIHVVVEDDGRYKPVGEWLIEFLVKCDRANVHAAREQKRLMEEADRISEWEDEQALRELEAALDRHAVDALGMKEHIGRGVTFATSRTPLSSHRST